VAAIVRREAPVSTKKTREHRFTWQDADGNLRVVHLSLVHTREGGKDEVRVAITGDGVPIKVDTFVEEIKSVKTRSRM
jgi:hypothetical protein